jgi:hypothetical protein
MTEQIKGMRDHCLLVDPNNCEARHLETKFLIKKAPVLIGDTVTKKQQGK